MKSFRKRLGWCLAVLLIISVFSGFSAYAEGIVLESDWVTIAETETWTDYGQWVEHIVHIQPPGGSVVTLVAPETMVTQDGPVEIRDMYWQGPNILETNGNTCVVKTVNYSIYGFEYACKGKSAATGEDCMAMFSIGAVRSDLKNASGDKYAAPGQDLEGVSLAVGWSNGAPYDADGNLFPIIWTSPSGDEYPGTQSSDGTLSFMKLPAGTIMGNENMTWTARCVGAVTRIEGEEGIYDRVEDDELQILEAAVTIHVENNQQNDDSNRNTPQDAFSLTLDGPDMAVGGGSVSLTLTTTAESLEAEIDLGALEITGTENCTVETNALIVADPSKPAILHCRVTISNGPGNVGCFLTNIRYKIDAADPEWKQAEDVSWDAPVPCTMENIPTPLPEANPGSTLRFMADEEGSEILTGWTCEYPRTVQGLLSEFIYTMGGRSEIYSPAGDLMQPEDLLTTGCVLRRIPSIGTSRDAVIILAGDPSCTGRNDITQLVKTAQFLSGTANPSSTQLTACDWNGNRAVDITDLTTQARMLTHGSLPLPTDRPDLDPQPQPDPQPDAGETEQIQLTGERLQAFLNDVCAPLALSAARKEVQDGANAGELVIAQQDAHFWDRYLYALMETQNAAEKFGADAVQYNAEYSLQDFYPGENWTDDDRNTADLVDGEAVRQYIRTVFGVATPENGLLAPGSDKYVFWRWDPEASVVEIPQISELTADYSGDVSMNFVFSGDQFGGRQIRCRLACHLEPSDLSPLGCVVTKYSVIQL